MTLTKRQKRELKKQGILDKNSIPQRGLILQDIKPKSYNQKRMFDSYDSGNNLLLHGSAGTGKTFCALYLSLDEIFRNAAEQYKKIIIIRSVVPTRDIGFLPGNESDKIGIYETPYKTICNDLFERGDAYDILKQKKIIEFMSTSFIRGITLKDTIIIVDEIQNLNFQELDSVITRVGENCKIVLCGDYKQTDLVKDRDRQGLLNFMKIIDMLEGFDHIEFTHDDIVRCNLVKQYIIAKDELGICA
jgi:predicted ribonuclease YlaK